MSGLTKHRTILRYNRLDSSGQAEFYQEIEEGEAADWYWLPIGTWEAMGQPQTITVTVEPGDLLNVEEADA